MPNLEIAVLGGGCFWCTEALFASLKGVVSVVPGYAGGQTANPTYQQVCGGVTGHAEVIKIEFDPSLVKFEDLLTVFFATHDSTTLNRQGADVGTQYRSVILYTSQDQKLASEKFIKDLDADGGKPVVTEIKPLTEFYVAENYHQNYYENNKDQPYCQVVINPKLEKLRDRFKQLIK